jgi:hypothetical protein
VASKQRSDGAADGAPCTDSNITLKEQMSKLGNVELLDEKEDDLGKTSGDEFTA